MKKLLFAIFVVTTIISFTSCRNKKEQDKAKQQVEKVKENVNDAVDKVSDKIEDGADAVKDAWKDTKKDVQNSAEKTKKEIKEGYNEVKKDVMPLSPTAFRCRPWTAMCSASYPGSWGIGRI